MPGTDVYCYYCHYHPCNIILNGKMIVIIAFLALHINAIDFVGFNVYIYVCLCKGIHTYIHTYILMKSKNIVIDKFCYENNVSVLEVF